MEPRRDSARRHVVLTDNEAVERKLFKVVLEELNTAVHFTEYSSGEKLCEMLQLGDKLPDMVFLDIDMPWNGIECLIKIRTELKLPALPIIMYSSNCDERTIEAAFYNGANYYFIKQSNITFMRRALEWLVEHDFTSRPKRHEFVIDADRQLPGD